MKMFDGGQESKVNPVFEFAGPDEGVFISLAKRIVSILAYQSLHDLLLKVARSAVMTDHDRHRVSYASA